MKKYYVVFLCIVSAILLSFLWNAESHYCLGVELKDTEQIRKILNEKVCIDPKEDTLWNDSHAVFYDDNTQTIFVSQALNTKKLSGNISASKGALFLEQDELLYDVNAAMEQCTKFKLYQVFDDSYCMYNLIITGVPMMCLSVEEEYQDIISDQEKTVSIATVEVVDPYHADASYQKMQGEFYRRGRTSYLNDYIKQNYKLNLTDGKESLLGMRKDDDWILQGLLDDMGLIHNKACYTIWNKLSEKKGDPKTYSTNMEYVDLFIDHKYMGTYGLMERIDEKELQLSEKDILYKIRSPRVMEDNNYTNEMSDGLRPIAITKFPKEPGEADWIPLKTWNDMFRHGWVDDLSDAYQIIDYQNALDYNIFCLLTYGIDNIIDNCYMVAEYQEDTGEYRIKKIPWDINQAFGCRLTPEASPETNWTYWDENTITNTSTWTPEMIFLYTHDEQKIAADLYNRWIELRQDFYTRENLYAILDELLNYLHSTGAYKHNYEWYPFDETAWNESFAYDYIDRRIEYLDKYFERLYRASIGEAIYVYDGVDYTAEFNPWTYWNRYEEELSENDGDEETFDDFELLEHYVTYGKPNGWIAK